MLGGSYMYKGVTPVKLLCDPPLDVSQTNMGQTCRGFVYIRVTVNGKEVLITPNGHREA